MTTEHSSSLRAFVAIELPPEVRAWCQAAIEQARRKLGSSASAVRWVDPAAIHLTLTFLGAVAITRVPVLIERLGAELANQAPFRLEIGGLGVFPGPRSPRVVWLAVLGDLTALGACQRRVEAATVPLGFPAETRPFKPHLTLGRVRETATSEQRAAIGALPANWPLTVSRSFSVDSVSLMQSHLGPGGARYPRLAEIRFGTAPR
ncbi:MAG: RNA 2',3'-cyclic phosphodiesterase [Chloroflexota bacterium]